MTDTITHIVLFKYRADIPWTTFESYFRSFMALKTTFLHPNTENRLSSRLERANPARGIFTADLRHRPDWMTSLVQICLVDANKYADLDDIEPKSERKP
jgi:hypothetical protein